MKLLCETQIVNRLAPQSKQRAVKATVAIGYHPPGKENAELFIIHFTPQNKTGFRYKVKDNIAKVFTKFLKDGKATISFKVPEHDLLLKCDPLQLKCFFQTMKLGLEGKAQMNKIGLSSLAVTAIPQKSHPVTNLIINRRDAYPAKELPRGLKSLTITNIGFHKMDSRIPTLKNLITLNLSDNHLSLIPKQLGELRLKDLDLSGNSLGQCTKSADWDWLDGLPLRTTLNAVDFSNNKLTFFPYKLAKLNNLVELKMSNNKLKKIPFAIGRMNNLRFLNLSSNELESLPQTIVKLNLDTFDIWQNNFLPRKEPLPTISFKTDIPPLWLLAARIVTTKRLPFSPATIPHTLVDTLLEAPTCICGKLCFSENIAERFNMLQLGKVKNFVFSRDRVIYMDCAICSANCAQKYIKLISASF